MPVGTMTSKGQITIPVDVRRDLGLHPGSRIAFIRTESGTYEIRVDSSSIRDLKGTIPQPRKPVTLEDMDRAIAQAAG